ncbi:MAG: hypothetical protein U1F57_09445 [bacterium]
MGVIKIVNHEGTTLEEANFGADYVTFGYDPNEEPRLEEYQNDGSINDLEVRDGRIQLEKSINKHILSSGGPLGLGGWGGKDELHLQAWRLNGGTPGETPDGFSMPVKVRLEEKYPGPGLIFRDTLSVTREVEMTIRWERGKVKLYQCTPPAYQPMVPPAPPAAPQEKQEPDSPMVAGVFAFFSSPISSLWDQFSRWLA